MAKELGTFTTVSDRKEASRVASLTGGVVATAGAAFSLRIGRWELLIASLIAGVVVYFVHRRIAMARTKRGVVDIVDDDELGVTLVLARSGPGVRVPLTRATIVGRTRTLASAGPVRLQIEIRWETGAIVANLAIPFRGAEGDVEGVLPADYDLDRLASRAFDALSYEAKAGAGLAPERGDA